MFRRRGITKKKENKAKVGLFANLLFQIPKLLAIYRQRFVLRDLLSKLYRYSKVNINDCNSHVLLILAFGELEFTTLR